MIAERRFATLVAALEAGQSDALTRYLTVASRFHQYSFNNQMLIAEQCPTATRVAGYHAWRRVGRWVRRGEKGIVILAPITSRRRDEVVEYDELETERARAERILRFRGTLARGHRVCTRA